jgi:hypothetical protein
MQVDKDATDTEGTEPTRRVKRCCSDVLCWCHSLAWWMESSDAPYGGDDGER